MPYLTKVMKQVEAATTPPRPLCASVAKTLAAFDRITAPGDDERVAKIEVHDTVSKVAWAYEKLRNAIDYQDEHLLRKNAIERILRRRLVADITAEQVAEPLVLELIRGGYLANNAIPVTMLASAANVVNIYIHVWTQVPTLADHTEMDRLFDWYLSLLAVELNELLSPVEHEVALAQLMFDTIHRDIVFVEDDIPEEEKNIQLYIAIQRVLLKSDSSMIRYHLFRRQHPEWHEPTPEVIASIGQNLPLIKQAIDQQLFHPAGELLQRLMKKYAIIFLIFSDIAEQYGPAAAETLTHPDQIVKDVTAAYNQRKKTVQRKIARSVIRSIIYVFITKMLLALVIELPFDRLLAHGGKVNYRPLLTNIIIHPVILFLIGVTIRPPGQKNEEAVIAKVQTLLYRGDDRNALVKPRKPIRRSSIFTYFYRVIYALTFVLVFGLLIWGLRKLEFNPVGMAVFLLFLTIVSFFGIRVRLLAKELVVVDQRENIFSILFDFFTVPILQVGRWISLRAPKVNVLIFFFDVIIEAPFKAFLEAMEGFFGFLREKREEIY
ncbi:MAG: hypothetical protein HY092_00075 [Candidatus Kerfeldbacteria bacterium]|nr:hypothetical protein [Candidatus Kerfeldbacteria bacterium]